jgi:hypothetical protein
MDGILRKPYFTLTNIIKSLRINSAKKNALMVIEKSFTIKLKRKSLYTGACHVRVNHV